MSADPSRDRSFVGRTVELEKLSALAQLAGSGRPAAAVVTAEPGLGKTRLLAEFARGLQTPRVELRGYELASEIPLSAAGGLLRALSAVPDEGERLDALLLGEVGAAGRALETVRLFEAAYRCTALAGSLTVIVDDIQWADTQTLSLLQYVLAGARSAGLRLLVLCAGRPSVPTNAFTSGLRGLLEPECFEDVVLGPLDQNEGIDLACLLAADLGPAEAQRLWRRAEGSPFWMKTLIGDRSESRPSALIRVRLTRLDSDAAELFGLLVVVAQPLRMQDIMQLLDWAAERVRSAEAMLVDRALVVHDAGGVRVAHDLIRETARAELPDDEQRRLHRLLASWLEDNAGDDVRQLLRALEHRAAAGLEGTELALRVARSPQRRLLGSDGLATVGAFADAAGAGTDLQREVAVLASELGEWTVAFERWAALADGPREKGERTRAALAAAAAAFRAGRAADVHVFVAKAREQAGDDPAVTIEADAYEALSLLWLENLVSEARPLVDRSAAVAQRMVERAGGVEHLTDEECVAYVQAMRAKLDAAIRRADADTVASCADLIRAGAREPAEALTAASDQVFSMLQFDGTPRAAEPRAHRLLEEARRRMLPSIEVEATHWVGWIAHHRGRLDEAAAYMDQAVTLAARVGPPRRFTIAQLRAVAASIDASRTEWHRNVEVIAQAIAAEPDPHFRLVIRLLHIWLVGRFAKPSAADLTALLLPMADDADRAGCGRCLWESVLHAAEAQARAGDIAGARASLERWDATHPSPRGGPAARRRYVAALLTMHDAPADSLPLFVAAGSDAAAVGYELMRLWVEIDAALAASRVDRSAGIAQLRAAARTAESIGALSEQQLAVQQLRALGVRTWRRGGHATPLTERELEIAKLVVAGQSNPEIAGALFLSRKTVERHISNILTKVGARNRTELAHRLNDASSAPADAGPPG